VTNSEVSTLERKSMGKMGKKVRKEREGKT
jgi:hypothetical protein